jgi:hypothetical protein
MTAANREVRIFYRGSIEVPVVQMGEVGKWSMVRHANYPHAMPFVISTLDWNRLKARAALAQKTQP